MDLGVPNSLSSEENLEISNDPRTPLLEQDHNHLAQKPIKGNVVAMPFFCALVASMGTVQYGYTCGFSSPVESAIISDLNLTLYQFSLFGSLPNVGAMVGAVAGGSIADYMGRKAGLIVASIPNIIGWLCIYFAEDAKLLYIGRFLTGLGVGSISFTGPVYIAEISPHQLRGTLGTVNMTSLGVGMLLAYLIGIYISWRPLALLGIVPTSLMAIGAIFVPESPRWLAKVGNERECKACLQALRGSADISDEYLTIKILVENSKHKSNISLLNLCNRKYVMPLTIVFTLLALQQLNGIGGILVYCSTIFESIGISSGNIVSLGIAVIMIIMAALSAVLVDKSGRRPLLMISSGGMAICLALTSLVLYLKCNLNGSFNLEQLYNILAVIFILIFVIFTMVGVGTVPLIIMAEILPANVRGIGGSIATFAMWFSSWLVTQTFNGLLVWSPAGTFLLFAAISGFMLVFVVLFVPETKGKSLEEIERVYT